MAQKVTVTLVDDLDGGTAEETVEFGIDGGFLLCFQHGGTPESQGTVVSLARIIQVALKFAWRIPLRALGDAGESEPGVDFDEEKLHTRF